MNLPLILDIAIGLIFIYLILSLLASEIQELFATLLQWRAEHLKKSIEVLIAGSSDDNLDAQKARKIANELYEHPLLKNLNQEAKGLLAKYFRKGSFIFTNFCRRILPKSENVFGTQKSGPSYIPPEAFAKTLIDKLQINKLAQILTVARLEKFKQDKLLPEMVAIFNNSNLSENIKPIIEKQLNKFAISIDDIVLDLRTGKIPLNVSLDRIADKLDSYLKNCHLALTEAGDTSGEMFLKRTKLLKQDIFSENERKILLATLKPTVAEVVQVITGNPFVYAEFEKLFQDKDSPTYKGIAELVDSLPQSLKDSLTALAERVKNGFSIDEDINQLQVQIETWFERSMERASGVYKRNAKGVAILVGLVVAVATNADTFHIVGSLSRNSILRATITQNAEQLVAQNPALNAEEFKTRIDAEVRKSLEEVPLPVGWNRVNQKQQLKESWKIPYLKQFLGWLVSGLAISMGSSFWFDLLSKVVNVRNTGKSNFFSRE
ncbi:MAG: hypothetical protein N3E45_01465 [Oscillatoriaceae bacterium SKW80]|nr:hypothetical protein [Oscillatoriaceae bacterium SKYG93]MCX8119497.1 hypothetical protein [Oscillatoriaceae bacterium SKW80]MDW8454964.1 hypothetical protein [Oscillatoriaceae cyanobacterium SKYGB_i_bin93]HIK28257.1 hypothetical protein [Oscillatoriaceae cyanobacterium M7585_C2015_266]